MFQVSRLNLVYSAEEDRLRLACENATGGRLVLWLTRRLVLRLLAELAELVQPAAARACGAGARSNATTRDGAAPDDRETAAVCPGSPAFADNTGGIGFLVTRLRLRLAQGGCRWASWGRGMPSSSLIWILWACSAGWSCSLHLAKPHIGRSEVRRPPCFPAGASSVPGCCIELLHGGHAG